MKRLGPPALVTLTLLSLGAALTPGDATGQQPALGAQLIGTWTYVAVDTVRPDGSRLPMYGPHPQGLATFDGSGHYMLLTARDDLPKFASANRMDGTPEEYKAVVQGSIAHFGRYTVNEAEKTITFRIEASTFPNWSGTEQKRPFTISGDELRWTTPGSSGGMAEVVLRRAR